MMRFSTLITYLLTYLLTPWSSHFLEANRFSASQEIPRILWNPKDHSRILKCPPAVPILRQLDPVHTPTSHFLKIHLNIILPSTPVSPKWSLSYRFTHQNPIYASPFPPYALHAPPFSFSRFSTTHSKFHRNCPGTPSLCHILQLPLLRYSNSL